MRLKPNGTEDVENCILKLSQLTTIHTIQLVTTLHNHFSLKMYEDVAFFFRPGDLDMCCSWGYELPKTTLPTLIVSWPPPEKKSKEQSLPTCFP